jgi:hypothetical protein
VFNGVGPNGLNTVFKFPFLRADISLAKSVVTPPLKGFSEVIRRPDLAIADEFTHRFLVAAPNLAILGYPAETHFE